VRGGPLDRRITFERKAFRENTMGEKEPYWAPLDPAHGTVWARYQPGSGAEQREAAIEAAKLPATFTTRWSALLAGVTTADRIIFDDQPFDIKSAVELGRREGLQFVAITQFQGVTP
jgi:SPP1 family predicted phage head-tail adaptor